MFCCLLYGYIFKLRKQHKPKSKHYMFILFLDEIGNNKHFWLSDRKGQCGNVMGKKVGRRTWVIKLFPYMIHQIVIVFVTSTSEINFNTTSSNKERTVYTESCLSKCVHKTNTFTCHGHHLDVVEQTNEGRMQGEFMSSAWNTLDHQPAPKQQWSTTIFYSSCSSLYVILFRQQTFWRCANCLTLVSFNRNTKLTVVLMRLGEVQVLHFVKASFLQCFQTAFCCLRVDFEIGVCHSKTVKFDPVPEKFPTVSDLKFYIEISRP